LSSSTVIRKGHSIMQSMTAAHLVYPSFNGSWNG
jgi:hypothetical protein